MARSKPFVHTVNVRYLEVDRQGVVFNMWYLAYLDDALTAFLSDGGLPYAELMDGGHDVQIVHTEVDWRGPLGFGDDGRRSRCRSHASGAPRSRSGSPCCRGRVVADASTVYVVVRTDGSGPCALPPALLAALGPVA